MKDKNKNIRVLHVFNQLNAGGAESVVVRLHESKSEHVDFSFAVHNSRKGDYDDQVTKSGGEIYVFPKFSVVHIIRYVKAWNNFFNSTEGKKIDIVHAHVGSTAAIYLLIAKIHGKKVLAHSHNMYPRNLDLKNVIYKIVSFPVRYISDGFLAPSIAAGVDRFGEKAISKKPFLVLHNGFNIDRYTYNVRERVALRQRLNISEDEIVVGNVGRLVTQKNQVFFLSVIAELKRLRPDLYIKPVIVGTGPLKSKLQLEAQRLGLSLKILEPQSDLQAVYSMFDVFLFPSMFEGLGNVVVEAQTNGLKVVMSDAVPQEAIVVGENVTIVSLKQLNNIWANDLLSAIEMGHTGLTEVERMQISDVYDVNQTRKELDAFYDRML